MIIVFFSVTVLLCCIPPIHSSTETNNSTTICPQSFSCPGLGPYKYPFYSATGTKCGLIKVNCTSTGGEIQIEGRPYEIIGKYDHNSSYGFYNLVIHNETFERLVNNNSCDALMNNFTFSSPSPLLYSITLAPFITLFKCTKKVNHFKQHKYNNYNECEGYNFYYNYFNGTVPSDLPVTCQVLHLPGRLSTSPGLDETNISSLISSYPSFLFELSTSCDDCRKNGSQCDDKDGLFQCLDIKKGRKLPPMILVSVVVLGVTSVIILAIIIVSLKRRNERRKKAKYNVKVEMFLKNHKFLAPKRYSYSEVTKMTNSFKVKIGQGGFGVVYKGVLKNRYLVAVKVLSEVKGDGEDFINEVASVSMTSHVNIVSFMGFCLEGRHRALIYEFMPNGSLERFIHGHGSSSSCQLGWEKLHQIAIGIARGLEYLYRGCSTRILHFDIKPHNILLDDDFCPKISDFGLAKLFREKESRISMSHMRGTPGYIAPELFSRNFGEISYKSDVYSYGMMILEMVGGRKNIEIGVDHTSEIYFPHWIYKKVELHDEQLGLHGIVGDEENRIARKMIIVGLWCIQTNPLNRPTITKVLEMLEGDLASLEIPPKPYLSSPPRSIGSPSTN